MTNGREECRFMYIFSHVLGHLMCNFLLQFLIVMSLACLQVGQLAICFTVSLSITLSIKVEMILYKLVCSN